MSLVHARSLSLRSTGRSNQDDALLNQESHSCNNKKQNTPESTLNVQADQDGILLMNYFEEDEEEECIKEENVDLDSSPMQNSINLKQEIKHEPPDYEFENHRQLISDQSLPNHSSQSEPVEIEEIRAEDILDPESDDERQDQLPANKNKEQNISSSKTLLDFVKQKKVIKTVCENVKTSKISQKHQNFESKQKPKQSHITEKMQAKSMLAYVVVMPKNTITKENCNDGNIQKNITNEANNQPTMVNVQDSKSKKTVNKSLQDKNVDKIAGNQLHTESQDEIIDVSQTGAQKEHQSKLNINKGENTDKKQLVKDHVDKSKLPMESGSKVTSTDIGNENPLKNISEQDYWTFLLKAKLTEDKKFFGFTQWELKICSQQMEKSMKNIGRHFVPVICQTNSGSLYKCVDCSYTTKFPSSMVTKRHIYCHENKDEIFECPQCEFRSFVDEVVNHNNSEHKSKLSFVDILNYNTKFRTYSKKETTSSTEIVLKSSKIYSNFSKTEHNTTTDVALNDRSKNYDDIAIKENKQTKVGSNGQYLEKSDLKNNMNSTVNLGSCTTSKKSDPELNTCFETKSRSKSLEKSTFSVATKSPKNYSKETNLNTAIMDNVSTASKNKLNPVCINQIETKDYVLETGESLNVIESSTFFPKKIGNGGKSNSILSKNESNSKVANELENEHNYQCKSSPNEMSLNLCSDAESNDDQSEIMVNLNLEDGFKPPQKSSDENSDQETTKQSNFKGCFTKMTKFANSSSIYAITDNILLSHMKKVCSICQCIQPTCKELANHVKTAHNLKGNTNPHFRINQYLAQIRICSHCGHLASDRRNLYCHYLVEHDSQPTSMTELYDALGNISINLKKGTCNICGFIAKNIHALSLHSPMCDESLKKLFNRKVSRPKFKIEGSQKVIVTSSETSKNTRDSQNFSSPKKDGNNVNMKHTTEIPKLPSATAHVAVKDLKVNLFSDSIKRNQSIQIKTFNNSISENLTKSPSKNDNITQNTAGRSVLKVLAKFSLDELQLAQQKKASIGIQQGNKTISESNPPLVEPNSTLEKPKSNSLILRLNELAKNVSSAAEKSTVDKLQSLEQSIQKFLLPESKQSCGSTEEHIGEKINLFQQIGPDIGDPVSIQNVEDVSEKLLMGLHATNETSSHNLAVKPVENQHSLPSKATSFMSGMGTSNISTNFVCNSPEATVDLTDKMNDQISFNSNQNNSKKSLNTLNLKMGEKSNKIDKMLKKTSQKTSLKHVLTSTVEDQENIVKGTVLDSNNKINSDLKEHSPEKTKTYISQHTDDSDMDIDEDCPVSNFNINEEETTEQRENESSKDRENNCIETWEQCKIDLNNKHFLQVDKNQKEIERKETDFCVENNSLSKKPIFCCQNCCYKSSSSGNFMRHKVSCLEALSNKNIYYNKSKNLFSCVQCDFKSSLAGIKKHIKKHIKYKHPIKDSLENVNQSRLPKISHKEFLCSHCKFETTDMHYLDSHIKKDHPDKNRENESKSAMTAFKNSEIKLPKTESIKSTDTENLRKEFVCSQCKFKTTNMYNLDVHIKTSHPKNTLENYSMTSIRSVDSAVKTKSINSIKNKAQETLDKIRLSRSRSNSMSKTTQNANIKSKRSQSLEPDSKKIDHLRFKAEFATVTIDDIKPLSDIETEHQSDPLSIDSDVDIETIERILGISRASNSFACTKCVFVAETNRDFKQHSLKHERSTRTQQSKISPKSKISRNDHSSGDEIISSAELTCSMCGYNAKTRKSLRIHIEDNHINGTLNTYQNDNSLLKEIKEYDTTCNMYSVEFRTCKICGHIAGSRGGLSMHLKRSKKCGGKGLVFEKSKASGDSNNVLKKNVADHTRKSNSLTSPSRKEVKSIVGPKDKPDGQSLFDLLTESQKDRYCYMCGWIAKTKGGLSYHIGIVHPKQYVKDLTGTTQCNMCVFKGTKETLVSHCSLVHRMKYSCEKCHFKLRDKNLVLIHNETAHTEENTTETSKNTESKEKRKRVTDDNEKIHININQLKVYKNTNYGLQIKNGNVESANIETQVADNSPEVNVCPRSSLKCKICSFKSLDRITLEDHVFAHENGLHPCNLCSFMTKSSWNLTRHKSEVHQGVGKQDISNKSKTPRSESGEGGCHEGSNVSREKETRKKVKVGNGKKLGEYSSDVSGSKPKEPIRKRDRGSLDCDLDEPDLDTPRCKSTKRDSSKGSSVSREKETIKKVKVGHVKKIDKNTSKINTFDGSSSKNNGSPRKRNESTEKEKCEMGRANRDYDSEESDLERLLHELSENEEIPIKTKVTHERFEYEQVPIKKEPDIDCFDEDETLDKTVSVKKEPDLEDMDLENLLDHIEVDKSPSNKYSKTLTLKMKTDHSNPKNKYSKQYSESSTASEPDTCQKKRKSDWITSSTSRKSHKRLKKENSEDSTSSEPDSPEKQKKGDSNKAKVMFKCPYCQYKAKFRHALETHFDMCHLG